MSTTKKTKRSQAQYPGLDKNVNRRLVREFMDQDYIDQLSADEKAWLSKFNDEWLTASFPKTKDKKRYSSKNIQKTAEQRKDCYDRNNARNRDLTGILKQRGHINNPKNLVTTVEDVQKKIEKNNVEDAMIDIIDHTSKLNKS